MKVIVALIKGEGKTQKEIFKTLTDAGFELHDIGTMYVAQTTAKKL